MGLSGLQSELGIVYERTTGSSANRYFTPAKLKQKICVLPEESTSTRDRCQNIDLTLKILHLFENLMC